MNRRQLRPLTLAAWTLLGLAPVAALAADPRKPATVAKISTLYAGETDLEARGAPAGDVAVSLFSADLETPLRPLSASTRLSAGFSYRGFQLDNGGGAPLPERLESIEARLSAFHKLNERWSLLGTLSPGAHAADGAFTTDSLALSGLFLGSYEVSSTLTLGAGLVFDSLSESLPVLPVVGVRWEFVDAWTFTVAFPSSGVSWRASDRLTLRATLELDVGSFYVEDDPAPGLVGKPSLRDTVADFTAVSGALGADYDVTDSLTVSASLGYNFTRTVDYDERGYELEANDGAPMVRLGLAYKF